MSSPLARLTGLLLVVVQVVLALAITAYLASFALHAGNILGYPYPLDYGEGPLLAQIERLRAGTSIWQLYADTSTPPYLVVNYPPFFLLLATALSWITGDGLLAGRLISLLATLGCVAALFFLTHNAEAQRRGGAEARIADPDSTQYVVRSTKWLVALLFLTIPVVREWGVLLRVDMLGVCLGLWGLYQLRVMSYELRVTTSPLRSTTRYSLLVTRYSLLAGVLFLLCLYTKPSLLAAPAAGCCWLLGLALFGPRESRRAMWRALLLVVGVLALGGVGTSHGLLARATAAALAPVAGGDPGAEFRCCAGVATGTYWCIS
ncbi:MAG: hypothetical protein MUD01_28290 [Chloroflexaceae bacterium]|nr:hypothetical protein [Chloroflexaceae bacterium]